jgi:hypothetical protein
MSNDMKSIMESWKRSIQEMIPDILDDPERAGKQANYKPHPHFTAIIQEIIPFANVLDIKPYYEDLKGVLDKADADPDEIAIASLTFLYAVGSVLVDGHPVAKMAKAGRKAAEVGFELAPKIASAAKKIEKLSEKAPFELKSKTVELAKELPAELKSKAVKQGKDLPFEPFELKSKPVKQGKEQPFVLEPKGLGKFDFDLKSKE